jgi:hypothetical protein
VSWVVGWFKIEPTAKLAKYYHEYLGRLSRKKGVEAMGRYGGRKRLGLGELGEL